MKREIRKLLALGIVVVMLLVFVLPMSAIAATTSEFTVTATGEYIAQTDNVTSYAFGTGATSSTANTSTSYIGITNTSTVQTDATIAVPTTPWTSGGAGWTHDNTGTAGANTVAMKAQLGPTAWGLGTLVIVETLAGSPNYIYENLPATTNFNFGVSLLYPTSFTDGDENSNTVRTTLAAG